MLRSSQPRRVAVSSRKPTRRHNSPRVRAERRSQLHGTAQRIACRSSHHTAAPSLVSSLDLLGKTALVSGGSRGIGLAVVEHLLDRGANVIFCSQSQDSVMRAWEGLSLRPHRAEWRRYGTATSNSQVDDSSSPPSPPPPSSLSPATTCFHTQLLVSPPTHATTQFAIGVQCDVSSQDSITALFATLRLLPETFRHCGLDSCAHSAAVAPTVFSPSLLVNAAGICEDRLLLRSSQDAINKTLNTNVTGTMLLTKGFLRQLAPPPPPQPELDASRPPTAPYFRVVCVSSVIGQKGNAGQAAYAASKAGVAAFARSMSREMRQFRNAPITFNAVAPGYIETDMTRDIAPEAMARIVAQVGLQRVGQPDEVAAVIGFLLSPASSYLNGQNIAVDGSM